MQGIALELLMKYEIAWINRQLSTRFFYRNLVYKNILDQICQNFKNILKT